jgi:glycosyltransferase involved in cell wall biosynthesis
MPGAEYDVAFYLPTMGPLIDPKVGRAGGAEKQIWLLARGLAKRGYRICVVVADAPGGLPSTKDGVDVIVRQPGQGGRGVRRWVGEISALWRTLGPLRAAIVVQRAAGFSTGLVGLITKFKRRRFVYSSANIVDFDYEQLAGSRRDLRLFHLGIRLADQIVVQTTEQALRCKAQFGREATVIRSIAEPAARRATSPDAFLWVGRLVRFKQPQAFLALARELPELRFRMVALGPGNDPALEREIVREAGSLARLELLPTRPRAELLPLYESAVAVVNTSEWEGMPNTLLEGWACGVPALSLTHDPDGVIASDGLGAFAGGSHERLVASAREMWASRHDRAALARRCVEYVRREHDIERVTDGWVRALGLSGPTSREAVTAPTRESLIAKAS